MSHAQKIIRKALLSVGRGTAQDVGVGHAQLPVGALTATQNDVLQADFSTQQQGGPSSSGAFPGAGQHGNWGGYNPRLNLQSPWGAWPGSALGGLPLPLGAQALPVIAQKQQQQQQDHLQGRSSRTMPTPGMLGLGAGPRLGSADGEAPMIMAYPSGFQLMAPGLLAPGAALKDGRSTRDLLASLFEANNSVSMEGPGSASSGMHGGPPMDPGSGQSQMMGAGGQARVSKPGGYGPLPPRPYPGPSSYHGGQMGQGNGQMQQQGGQMQQQGGASGGAGGLDRGKRPRGTSSSVALNKEIMAAASVEELLAIVRARSHQFDFFNISSAVSRAPKLVEFDGMHHGHGHSAHGGSPMMHHGLSDSGLEAGGSGAQVQASAQQHAQHLSPAARELADRLCVLAMDNMRAFDARGLANTAWAFGKLRYVPDAALPALLSTHAVARIHEFAAQNLSNLAWAMVYMHHKDEQLLGLMSQKIRALVSQLKPQELANVFWAFASLEHHDPATSSVLAARALRLAPLFKEQELSNIVWSLGRSHTHDPQLLGALLHEARTKLHHFMPQGVSNVVWALGQLQHRDDHLLGAIARQFGPMLHQFDVQALANLAWGLAALGHPDTAFMAAIANEASMRLERMSPQNMSNLVWACATLGVRCDRLVEGVAREALERLPAFEPQGLANLAWGMSALGHTDPAFYDALAGAIVSKAERFNGQALATAARAFAPASAGGAAAGGAAAEAGAAAARAAGAARPELWEALARRAVAVASSLNGAQCAALAAALAGARCVAPDALDALLVRAMAPELLSGTAAAGPAASTTNNNNAAGGNSGAAASAVAAEAASHLVAVLKAAAELGHEPGALGPLLVGAVGAAAAAGALRPADVCSALGSLAALDLLDASTFGLLCSTLELQVAAGETVPTQGLQQVFQASLLLQTTLARSVGVPLPALDPEALPRLPALLEDHALAAWAQAARAGLRAPRLTHAVSSTLAAAGVAHTTHWLTDDGLMDVDVALQVEGRPVALLLCEQEQLGAGAGRVLGDALVRHRLLQARGWDVALVTAAEWEALEGLSATERAAALLERVSQQVPVAPLGWAHSELPTRGAATLASMGLDASLAAALMQQQQGATVAATAGGSSANLLVLGGGSGSPRAGGSRGTSAPGTSAALPSPSLHGQRGGVGSTSGMWSHNGGATAAADGAASWGSLGSFGAGVAAAARTASGQLAVELARAGSNEMDSSLGEELLPRDLRDLISADGTAATTSMMVAWDGTSSSRMLSSPSDHSFATACEVTEGMSSSPHRSSSYEDLSLPATLL